MKLSKRWQRRKTRPSGPAQSEAETLQQRLPDASDSEIATILRVQPYTMTSPERILGLCRAVEYIQEYDVPGDFVECGVWRGGSMAAAALTAVRHDAVVRDLWLYDTFEGMSPPTGIDVDLRGQTASKLLELQLPDDPSSVWCRSSLQVARQVMESTAYPSSRIHFVEGQVEQTLPRQKPEKISLLRLDTDWYESTICELEHLYPRLSVGGVLIIDDYGHWQGCRKAVDEYFARNSIRILLNRMDYTGRIGIKQDAGNAAGAA